MKRQQKIITLVIGMLFVLLVVGCSPGATTDSAGSAAYQGITFSYSGVAEAVEAQSVAAEAVGDPQPGGSGNPPFIRFAFDPDPSVTAGVEYKSMIIYPVAAYDQWLADNGVSTQMGFNSAALSALLSEQPAVPGIVPEAPLPTASQVYQAQVKYLTFTEGNGVRFVANYAQDVSPASNLTLNYVFQGLTADGKHWVTLHFPITSSALSDSQTALADVEAKYGSLDEFVVNYDAYLAETVAMLNGQSSTAFTPDLAALDAMIQSLVIPADLDLK